MRVFVAGGGGVVGRQLVPRLVVAGHQVVGTTRSPSKLAQIRSWGAQGVVMDGLDATSVSAAVMAARPEVVVHEMTDLASVSDLRHFDRKFDVTNRLRTDGGRYLLDAAAKVGARRLISQGFTGWTKGRDGPMVKDEADPFDPDPPKSMRRSLAAIAQLEQEVTAATDIEGIVLHYGNFYGPGSTALLEVVRNRKLPVVGGGLGVWSFIHLADAAAATVAALTAGEAGAYNIVDDEPVPASTWIPYLADVLGAKPPLHVPVWAGKLVAGEAAVSMMTQIRGASNGKAKGELGWAPRYASWREGFQAWVAEEEATRQKEAA